MKSIMMNVDFGCLMYKALVEFIVLMLSRIQIEIACDELCRLNNVKQRAPRIMIVLVSLQKRDS